MQMGKMPASVQPPLRRLARRLAIGLFLDVWPAWAAASLLLAGLVALVCRLFFPGAAPACPGSGWRRSSPRFPCSSSASAAYRPADVVALADWLGGGQGMLLTLLENDDPAWAASPLMANASRFALPRLRPWRTTGAVLPAAAFLAVAWLLPQRLPPPGTNAALADEIAANLTATVVELKQQELITPEEEKRLEEEIERIRRGAEERVDASSWEAADALREQVVAGLSEKQDAVKWAEESLARYAAAAQAGGDGDVERRGPGRRTDEGAREARAERPARGRARRTARLLQGRQASDRSGGAARADRVAGQVSRPRPTDASASSRDSGKEFGRFDPSEFPLESSQSGPDGDGDAGQRRRQSRPRRCAADVGQGDRCRSIDSSRSRCRPAPRGVAGRLGAGRRAARRAAGIAGAERAVGRPAVRRRRRPERLAPLARAATSERREEVLRQGQVSHRDALTLVRCSLPHRVADGQAKIARSSTSCAA